MMNLIRKLNRPYHFNNNWQFHLLQALIFGAFVFLFLEIFRPFQIGRMSGNIHLMIMGFGLVTSVVMIFLNVLVPLFPLSYFNEEKWTVGKELFYSFINVSAIGFFNFLYFGMLTSLTLRGLLWFQFSTWAVGLLPLTIMVLYKETQLRKRYEKEAADINNQLNTIAAGTKVLSIVSNNLNEPALEIPLNNLLYCQSQGNYVDVVYLDHEVKTAVIRRTLKELEAEFHSIFELFRCHKSHIVNLAQVERVTGNSQGYKLSLKGIEEKIPVSRQHHAEIKERLAIHPKS